jgi:hypothetical protein
MKKILLPILFLLSFSHVFSQKVDLDRFSFDVKYQLLPSEYVPYENRTFGVHTRISGVFQNYTNDAALYDKINIEGWKKVETPNPTVGIDINLEDFIEKGSTLEKRVVENKDKDGKLISTDTYYYMQTTFAVRGNAKINGPLTPRQPTAQELEEKAKKEQAASTNRFLKNAVLKPAETAPVNEGIAINFSRDLVVKSDENKDSRVVSDAFNRSKGSLYQEQLRKFVDGCTGDVMERSNRIYGFRSIATRDILWILDAKNDEGATQKEAIEAVKGIFATMKADEPLDLLASNLQPLIEYFESLKTKYTSDDKPGRKMRYSAYYNLAKIYYYLDQPEKVIKEAEALIANDYDTKDGKNLIEQAIRLQNEFAQSKIKSRHNIPLK